MKEISLEYFRNNIFATTMCNIQYKMYIPIQFSLTYMDSFNITTMNFVSLLRQFENSSSAPLGFNSHILQVFTNYFACLEQFTNTLFTMLHFYLETGDINDKKYLEFYKIQDYKNRLRNVLKLATNNDISFKKTGLFNKIDELARSRNYIIHGNFGKLEQIKKTALPSFPLTMNYEDVMEELNLIINIIEYFRYILPNIDLIPHFTIFIGSAVFNKKLDELFYKVLVPYLNDILVKHKFAKTRTYEQLGISALESIESKIANDIKFWIQIKPEIDFDYSMNEMETNYWIKHLHNIIGDKEPAGMCDKIQLPKYMLS